MTTRDDDRSVQADQRQTGDAQSDQPADDDLPGEVIAGPDPRVGPARNSHAARNLALLRQAERELEDEENDR